MNPQSTPMMEVFGGAVKAEGGPMFGPADLMLLKRTLLSRERTSWREELYDEDARRELTNNRRVHAPGNPQEPLSVAFTLDLIPEEVPLFQRFVAAAGLGVEITLRNVTGQDEFYGCKRVHRVEHVTCTLHAAEFGDSPHVGGIVRVWAEYEVFE